MSSTSADRFADYDVGLEMSVPHGWAAAETDEFPLVLIAPESDGFRANVGIRIGVVDPPTLEAFQTRIEATKAARRDELSGFHIVSERVGPQAGHPGWQMRATWESEGRHLTQITQLFVVEPARLYDITATCLQDAEKAYLPLFRAILDSWAVLPDEVGSGPDVDNGSA